MPVCYVCGVNEGTIELRTPIGKHKFYICPDCRKKRLEMLEQYPIG